MKLRSFFVGGASDALKRSIGRPRSFSVDLRAMSRAVNREVNFLATSTSKLSDLKYVDEAHKDDRIYKMAASHLGIETDELFHMGPIQKAGKLPNPRKNTRHVYEEGMGSVDLDNDIWLGYSRLSSFFTVELEGSILGPVNERMLDHGFSEVLSPRREPPKRKENRQKPMEGPTHLKANKRTLRNVLAMERRGDSAGDSYGQDSNDTLANHTAQEASLSKEPGNASADISLSSETSADSQATNPPITPYSVFLRSLGSSGKRSISSVGASLLNKTGAIYNEKTFQPLDDYTIFVYPYRRDTSKHLVNTLTSYKDILSPMDTESLIYLSGTTGSTRLFRLVNQLLAPEKETHLRSIHSVEDHAWPWMTPCEEKKFEHANMFLLLDALSASSISKYTFDRETAMYERLLEGITFLSEKVKKISKEATHEDNAEMAEAERSADHSDSQEADGIVGAQNEIATANSLDKEESIDYTNLKNLDTFILHKIVRILILKRNFSQLNNDHIRVFSDFISDRLHRLHPKCIANIAFTIGHSQNLDEFWMFMMSKHIEGTIFEYDCDDVTAIADAYASAGLEDYTFYEALCKRIKHDFDKYNIYHISILLRSLAKVRFRDEELLNMSTRVINDYAAMGTRQFPKMIHYIHKKFWKIFSPGVKPLTKDNSEKSTSSCGNSGELKTKAHKPQARKENKDSFYLPTNANNMLYYKETYSLVGDELTRDSRKSNIEMIFSDESCEHEENKTERMNHVDPYVIATTLISAHDLNYTGENLDNFWKVITTNASRAKFDVYAINWLPITAITFFSKVTLMYFLPVWVSHTKHTLTKMRSKSQIMTLKRRQLLLKISIESGIIPREYIPQCTIEEIEEICKETMMEVGDEYKPESSTFHLEVSSSLKALEIVHQREINTSPFVMDIIIPPTNLKKIKSELQSDLERTSDDVRSGQSQDLDDGPKKYTRHSVNFRKRKNEVYVYKDG
ncbi:conserved hypothetical protein [Theileria equi strain WA]|uniref:Uncharacterized protein n=1 Tax=Theileria equi strain WA TaxID=1537102 RepID=L1LEA5_THEEQ|nr:conserved hypothetical protein [Theileria equi strain WA]EKX73619.1 conserved hypothetical protein [Theileria equi strain WA]|eukprot:XP_004833071.1 conserved hypothetical protein [Theileria equi strain WA]